MATVTDVKVRTGRRSELGLLGLAVGLAVLARGLVDYHADFLELDELAIYAAGWTAVALLIHLAIRRWAPFADPVLVPAVLGLNGIGLAMIRRMDFAYAARGRDTDFGEVQIAWTLLGVALAMLVILLLRDYRLLRRFTYTAGVLGLIGLLLPLVPGLGTEINGARIWISVFGRSLQPAEFAKIAFVIFFAGFLVTNRDTLALAGPKVLGMRFPRPRDMGPLALVWVAAMLVQIYERDLGTSLLLFGIFVAMLYVATERLSWVIVGLGMFATGAVLAGALFSHVASRYTAWLHALDAEVYRSGTSEQLVRGLFGMASGGLFGTGLGEGRPDLVPYAESDFIVASIGEELGLTGLMAILTLYVIIVQRAMRTAIGTRHGFGKLLAAGLGFAIALQVFIVVGGVTRVIPLTGLTTPFLAYGGSSMLANWIVIGLLLRLSDQARRPEEVTP
ncbi:FtsW/RodA/SpoVE family cell cycle protein [Demequina mangrovi]|uniref:Cell elongation-specific peptidoglycan biosynthesis regulator RodA n=1 Tax=Demequina mangrovi TaxID=1043493 RepID=A0A1H6ZVJ7_9MICO|nr:FtsW/RodA/SpoVE family cell cycle protein [Demequina mangrovi]SEJ56676.1 cell elongation-specific peptidoglycan biosynthesis regulator RodA [Demequina mangrovi]